MSQTAPSRHRLPNRRGGDTLTFKSECLGGAELHLETGEYADGRLGEIFVHGARSGSHTAGMICEWAAAISIALQCGASLDEIASNIQREQNGKPATVLGETLDALMAARVAA